MGDELRRAQLRANQYQHVDGTFELTFGITFLLMAASFWGISQAGGSNSFLAKNVYPWIPLIVFLGGGILIDSLVKKFRLRVTVRRSGYMETRKPEPLKRSTRLAIWIGIPLLTIFLLVVLFFNRGKFQTGGQDGLSLLMAPFTGFLLGGLWIIAGWKLALWRFHLVGALSLIMSAAIFLGGLTGYGGMAVLLGGMGAALCVSGGITLWRYLRMTKSADPVTQEN